MNTFKVPIEVPADQFDELSKLLKSNEPVPQYGSDEVLATFTADFSKFLGFKGYQIDVKVVNGENGPCTEAVLFYHGQKISCSEVLFVGKWAGQVGEELEGEWVFKQDWATLVAVIKRKREYNDKLDPARQVDVEERIASYLFDNFREGFSEEDAGEAGRHILKMVLQEFRPALLE